MASHTANHRSWKTWAATSVLGIFILLLGEITADDSQRTSMDVVMRKRRDVTTETVESRAGIPENIPNDVILYDLGQAYPNRTFTVTGNIARTAGMFVVNNNGRLVLAPGLSETKRKMFDYDTYRTFEVYINATDYADNTDIIMLTVRLTLQDVNDESPVFTNVPRPFQTTISTDTAPETEVYRLTVFDPDTNANIVLRIDQASQLASRYQVRAGNDIARGKVFRIVTVGTEPFTSNTLKIYAEDTNAVGQRTDAEIILSTDPLRPQFYQQTYRGRIYETQNTLQWVMTESNTELEVQVKQFQQGASLTFQLLEESTGALSQNFEIRADGSDRTKLKIRNIRAIDYEGNLPKPVNLIVRATESSARTSTATVIVEILDDNDNSPIFAAPQYRSTVPENRQVGSLILEVTASDLDSGKNGEIEFSLSNDTYFAVRTKTLSNVRRYVGEITIARELDYERNTQHTFSVIATDKGPSPRSTSVQVNVYITNVNDNDPEFLTKSNDIPALIDTASPNAVVAIIQAIDKDGDRVQYFFQGRTADSDIFRIERNNGLIRLRQAVPQDRDSYTLTVLAVDDDSCCTVKTRPRTSTATYTVQIRDSNVNKPNFQLCRTYDTSASVKEKADRGTEVIVVSANDPDRGENGKVLYRLESPNPNIAGAPLDIDENTGNITVKGDIVRDQAGFIQVTVIGRNPGDFPLMEGRCTFRLTVQDINDHAPSFSEDQYTVDVSISTKPPSIVRQMVATDADVGSNANLTYSFGMNDTDALATFSIHPLTGVITLIKEMDAQKSDYTLIVIANDQGTDPKPLTGQTTVIVTVNLEQRSPPSWINLPSSLDFRVKESDLRGFVVTSLTCQSNSGTPGVEYRVFDAKGSIIVDSTKFIPVTVPSDGKIMNLTLNERLDYETEKEHQLSIVCQTFGAVVLRNQINAKITVIDTNDNIPRFQGLDEKSGRYVGTVAEDAPPGTSVLQVSASDADTVSQYRTVTFRLIGDNSNLFRVRELGGNKADILTSNSLTLDRESVTRYSVQIEARDSAPADPPLANQDRANPNTAQRIIDIVVNDVNDNPPSFRQTLYNFSVSETANVNEGVAEVKADDPDSLDQGRGLNYIFTSGNVDNAFSILAGTGKIRVARKLDYENPKEPKIYNMTLMAVDLDQRFNATTRVTIRVLDANDNRPEFSESKYIVEGVVTEEDDSNTQSNPLFLVKVIATDKDVDRPQTQIRYSLLPGTYTTPGPDQRFRINATSGEVFLVGKLDREEYQNYVVTVAAEDELIQPNIEYVDVVVSPMDINDNKPTFQTSYLQGSVDEHAKNQRAFTLLATDPDEGVNGTVQYKVAPNQGQPDYSTYFSVKTNGDIFTTDNPDLLDREKIDKLQFVVQAYDLGSPTQQDTATVTITLNDINDQSPYFPETLYNAQMSENLHEGGQVKIIEAIDLDSDPRNKDLRFEIRGDPDQIKHFAVMRSDQLAVITVVNPVDYETDPHTFSFELHVTDGKPGHANTTNVVVHVEDYNDNPPVFTEDIIRVIRTEEEAPGELLATFNATDKDEGINAEFEFSIVRSSDPRYEFYVHPMSGEVTTRKRLDREVEEVIEVIIMAKDKGEKPLNSTAKLIVTLRDINDNGPQFKENYRPQIVENQLYDNTLVVELLAIDPDTPENGPPFGFEKPSPCETRGCEKFSLTFNPDGDGGNGSARITTSGRFDREEQKEYHIPIIMWDQYGKSSSSSLTATNTLTIIIADKNDNDQKPGHQDIFVYNYEGQFGEVEIGRVYVDDPDDWDVPDKTFTFLYPENMKQFFSVASDTGMVSMKPGVTSSGSSPYEFEVRVVDNEWKSTVTCTVSVTVQTLSDESVRKSGGVRLAGITAEEFVESPGSGQAGVASMSKYDKFRQTVASLLGYPGPNNIDIVALTDGPGYLDVRFSGHASPFVNPSQGESVIMLDLEKFENGVGVKVAQVPINLCMEEIYDDGCYNNLNVTGAPRLVNSNGTSYVVMDTSLAAKAGCVDELFPDPVECRGDYCFNGGTCHKDDWGKLSCSCPKGYDGPRCQQRRHNFDGSSIAFYKSLSVCSSGRTSIEFITLEETGIIMFTGPIDSNTQDQHDYLLLELIGGYPSLTLSLGTKKVTLSLDGKNQNSVVQMNKLSDGQWHHVDIDRDNQKVTLTIDHCKYATAAPNGTVSDWSSCRQEDTVPGPDVLLNVQTFLQLGGRYQSIASPPPSLAGVSTKYFSGCLRNLVHNSKLYDLHFKTVPNLKSGNNGCPREEGICGEGSNQLPQCGSRATCDSRWQPQEEVASCRCHAGWYGQKCNKEAPIRDLKQRSFFKWRLSPALIDETRRMGSLQMMFRTRQTSGTLMTLSTATTQQIKIQLNSGKVRVSFDMGTEEQHLILSNAPANTGQWHLLRMERYGNEFILSMDGGEGRKYRFEMMDPSSPVIFEALEYISAGAGISNVATAPSDFPEDLVDTCVQDIRYNDKWLPLTKALNNDPDAGATLDQIQGVVDDCVREDCAQVTCTDPLKVCYPLWEAYECRCGPDYTPNAVGACIPLCDQNNCFNNAECKVENNQAVCVCSSGWRGPLCASQVQDDSDDAGLGAGAIVGIIIGILLLIVLIVLLLCLLTRRKKEKEKILVVPDPDDDFIRENVMFYDEEGAGEEDHDAYDITLLQRPDREAPSRPNFNNGREDEIKRANAPRLDRPDVGPRSDRPDVGSFIKDRIEDTENDDPFNDSTREFNFEGGNSDAGSLSSLNTSSSGGSQDYDYLSGWGPKFAKLADMYGAGQNLED